VRGTIANGKVSNFQVVLKVGFRVMDPKDLQAG
jgi:flavin-binding protein dodecin